MHDFPIVYGRNSESAESAVVPKVVLFCAPNKLSSQVPKLSKEKGDSSRNHARKLVQLSTECLSWNAQIMQCTSFSRAEEAL